MDQTLGLEKMNFYMLLAGVMTVAIAGGFYVWYVLAQGVLRRTVSATMQDSVGGSSNVTMSERVKQPRHPAATYAQVLNWVALAFFALAVFARWMAVGHAPYANQYEFGTAFTFAIVLLGLILMRQFRQPALGAFISPVAVLMGIYVLTLPANLREINPLIPALQSPILTIHVGVAILAYGIFAIGFVAAVMYLLQRNGEQKRSWLPSRAILDDIGYRSVLIGFPLMILVLVLGGIWANIAWGAFWSWDPKETAALATTLVYGVYLHAHSLKSWSGNRAAWLLILGFAFTLFTFFGNYFLGGLHTYGGV